MSLIVIIIITLFYFKGNFWCGLAVNGLYNVALEFIIRQFKVSASFMSSVPASYGSMQVLFILPFTYRFGRKNKPVMMAFCFTMFSLGCVVFTFPHMFSDAYVPMDEEECDAKCESNIQNCWLFVKCIIKRITQIKCATCSISAMG